MNNVKNRMLEVTISIGDGDFFDIEIYDPQTGDLVSKSFPFSPDEHPEFNEWIGNEVYDWVEYTKPYKYF